MPICKLCQEKEADRKNTHYLTDAIIRSALNHDGGNARETGMMFDISNNRNGIQARFQRSTSAAVVEEAFGRAPTEEEIEQAKKVPFSVDHVFCTGCEKIFIAIEEDFLKQVLPQMRGHDFKGVLELNFDEAFIIRNSFCFRFTVPRYAIPVIISPKDSRKNFGNSSITLNRIWINLPRSH